MWFNVGVTEKVGVAPHARGREWESEGRPRPATPRPRPATPDPALRPQGSARELRVTEAWGGAFSGVRSAGRQRRGQGPAPLTFPGAGGAGL